MGVAGVRLGRCVGVVRMVGIQRVVKGKPPGLAVTSISLRRQCGCWGQSAPWRGLVFPVRCHDVMCAKLRLCDFVGFEFSRRTLLYAVRVGARRGRWCVVEQLRREGAARAARCCAALLKLTEKLPGCEDCICANSYHLSSFVAHGLHARVRCAKSSHRLGDTPWHIGWSSARPSRVSAQGA